MHETYKKCFPNEDSSGVFNQEKEQSMYPDTENSLAGGFTFKHFTTGTYYIVQQLRRELTLSAKTGAVWELLCFKWWNLLDLSIPQNLW